MGRAIVEQGFVAGQFVQAVCILALAVIHLFLAIRQLSFAVGQFSGSVGQLLVGIRFGVVVLSPGVIQLGTGISDDAVIAGFTPGIGDGLDVGLDRINIGLVGVAQAVLLQRAFGGQVDFGVGFVGEILLGDVEHQLDRAVAHAGGLALKAEIVGVVHDTHDGVLGGAQLGVQIFVGFVHHQLCAHGIGRLLFGVAGFDDALAGLFRQAPSARFSWLMVLFSGAGRLWTRLTTVSPSTSTSKSAEYPGCTWRTPSTWRKASTSSSVRPRVETMRRS